MAEKEGNAVLKKGKNFPQMPENKMRKADLPYEIIRKFDSRKDFYNAIIFEKPTKQIIDGSFLLRLSENKDKAPIWVLFCT